MFNIYTRILYWIELHSCERYKAADGGHLETLIRVKKIRLNLSKTVAIDTPGGNHSLKIKSRAQQITLNPNIINSHLFFQTM